MNDRELLELAAKAVKIKIDKSTTNGGGLHNDGFDLLGNAVLDWHNGTTWNPLTDDGDALRLAVKLKMMIDHVATGNKKDHIAAVSDLTSCREPIQPDPYAATRRAIVRAAAEIGKCKSGQILSFCSAQWT